VAAAGRPHRGITGDDLELELEVDLFSLMNAFHSVLQRAKLRPKIVLPPEQLRSRHGSSSCSLASLKRGRALRGPLRGHPGSRRAHRHVPALLEMIRLKLVGCFSRGGFGPIRVYKRSRPADAPHPIGDPEEIVAENDDEMQDGGLRIANGPADGLLRARICPTRDRPS